MNSVMNAMKDLNRQFGDQAQYAAWDKALDAETSQQSRFWLAVFDFYNYLPEQRHVPKVANESTTRGLSHDIIRKTALLALGE